MNKALYPSGLLWYSSELTGLPPCRAQRRDAVTESDIDGLYTAMRFLSRGDCSLYFLTDDVLAELNFNTLIPDISAVRKGVDQMS